MPVSPTSERTDITASEVPDRTLTFAIPAQTSSEKHSNVPSQAATDVTPGKTDEKQSDAKSTYSPFTDIHYAG